jgi:hypothetical protein
MEAVRLKVNALFAGVKGEAVRRKRGGFRLPGEKASTASEIFNLTDCSARRIGVPP